MWTRLGADFATAMRAYGRLESATATEGSVGVWVQYVIDESAKRVKPRTLDQYRRVTKPIMQAFAEFGVHQVRPEHVAQFMEHYRDTPNWANRARTVLKMAMDAAVRLSDIDSNPVDFIQRHTERERDRYITDKEYRAIWNTAWSAGYRGPALCAIMDLAYGTGQRISDVLANPPGSDCR